MPTDKTNEVKPGGAWNFLSGDTIKRIIDQVKSQAVRAGRNIRVHQVAEGTFIDYLRGACCKVGICSTMGRDSCSDAGGEYQGDDSACSPNPCAQTGGCCHSDGTCSDLTESDCADAGGIWQGLGVNCSDITCPSQTRCQKQITTLSGYEENHYYYTCFGIHGEECTPDFGNRLFYYNLQQIAHTGLGIIQCSDCLGGQSLSCDGSYGCFCPPLVGPPCTWSQECSQDFNVDGNGCSIQPECDPITHSCDGIDECYTCPYRGNLVCTPNDCGGEDCTYFTDFGEPGFDVCYGSYGHCYDFSVEDEDCACACFGGPFNIDITVSIDGACSGGTVITSPGVSWSDSLTLTYGGGLTGLCSTCITSPNFDITRICGGDVYVGTSNDVSVCLYVDAVSYYLVIDPPLALTLGVCQLFGGCAGSPSSFGGHTESLGDSAVGTYNFSYSSGGVNYTLDITITE